MEEEYELKWHCEINSLLGKSIGIGISGDKTEYGTEVYLFINMWSYAFNFGKMRVYDYDGGCAG